MAAAGAKGMIFLDTFHPIVLDTLQERFEQKEKGEPIDVTASDFDDVRYHIVVNKDADTVVNVQLALPCYKDIAAMGASAVVDGMYGAYKASKVDAGYDVAFNINTASMKEPAAVVAKNFSELKRNLLGAPMQKCFDALVKGQSGNLKPMVIKFRPSERMVLLPAPDRVYVYFSIYFLDEADRAIARVFLQEFSEAQRKMPQAPSVMFNVEVPSDLQKVSGFTASKDAVGYIQFQLFKNHVEGAKMDKVVSLLTSFRAYLHYHIKASKAHLHSRMRARVESLLKVLRRADPTNDEEGGKKAYRTYQYN